MSTEETTRHHILHPSDGDTPEERAHIQAWQQSRQKLPSLKLNEVDEKVRPDHNTYKNALP
jgi:hypothetical protein